VELNGIWEVNGMPVGETLESALAAKVTTEAAVMALAYLRRNRLRAAQRLGS
jgi:hypothetical protein